MSVFPGGRVEGADAELPIVGSSVAEAAARFGTNDRSVRGFVGAAARELFEETGILLGAPPAVLADAETAAARDSGLPDFEYAPVAAAHVLPFSNGPPTTVA